MLAHFLSPVLFIFDRYLEFQFNTSIQNYTREIVAYKLTSSDDLPNRDPRDFSLQIMTRVDPTRFVTVDTRANVTFSNRLQTRVFYLANSFVGNITTIRLWISTIANGGIYTGIQVGEFQVFEGSPGRSSMRRLTSEPAQGVEEGGGASSRGLRGRPTSGVVVGVSSPEDSQEVSRQLQTGKTTIGGYGVASVKFGRRRYHRNLLTGEESWEEYEEHQERRLQVGGSSAFQLELEIQQFPREDMYGKSSASTANVVISLTIVAISSVFFFYSK